MRCPPFCSFLRSNLGGKRQAQLRLDLPICLHYSDLGIMVCPICRISKRKATLRVRDRLWEMLRVKGVPKLEKSAIICISCMQECKLVACFESTAKLKVRHKIQSSESFQIATISSLLIFPPDPLLASS